MRVLGVSEQERVMTTSTHRAAHMHGAPVHYSPEMLGRTATTRWGEHGTIVGRAQSTDRCGFLPDGATIYMTPQIRHLTFDAVQS